jgi:translation initiation factor 1 (eIF-1/SUI1)
MKKYSLLFACVLMLAACSTPKYAYYFDHYDYNSGKKKTEKPKTLLAENTVSNPEMSPLRINEDAVTASVEKRILTTENTPVSASNVQTLKAKYAAMSKSEKKEFRKELKSEVKQMIKAKKSGKDITSISNTQVMDHDLKMALIFGIVGIVLSAFAGVNPAFWILGVISIVVAIVFLISWLADQ